jgi:hypothetical protein
VFQLGDLGGYTHCGSQQSFNEGRDFLGRFGRETYTILGNHDLEGPDFETDAEAVMAWCRTFGYRRPYQAIDLGEALGVCLSTTVHRNNPHCGHEVRFEEDQLDWLRATLAEHADRPTFVFAHAPVIGSGLRVLQSVHLRCPNAWVNHRHNPGQLRDLVVEHPQIKLWFSAHDHLGQDYADSTSLLGQCLFVHTGVIGPVTRDFTRQSRMVEFNADGYVLSTVDHRLGRRLADLRFDYSAGQIERLRQPAIPDESVHFAPPPLPAREVRLEIGDRAFTVHRGMVVEFDLELAAPIGIVSEGLSGHSLAVSGDELLVIDQQGCSVPYAPDEQGNYGQIYAPNTWRGRVAS